jgi:hypothetical protein
LAGRRLQKKSPGAETYKISNNPGTGTPPLRHSNRTKVGGGDPGKGTPRKKPRGESPGYVFQIDRLLAEAATKPPREDTLSEDGDVKARARHKDSDKDKAATSAARRSYTASGAADNPKAASVAVRRARTAKAVVPTTEAHNEGADGDLTLLAVSGTTNDSEATAYAARRARTARAAARKAIAHDKGTDGARYKGSGNDEAEASAARRVDVYAPSAAALSAARRAHAVSGPTDNPKATASAARHAHTARAAVRAAKATGATTGAATRAPATTRPRQAPPCVRMQAPPPTGTRQRPSPRDARA